MDNEKMYFEQFESLKTARLAGVNAPHKAILLITVIDLIDWGVIKINQIELNDNLEWQFKHNWSRYIGSSVMFQAKIATPFWHMSNEPFWRLISHNGDIVTKDNIQGGLYSLSNLRKNIAYAELDIELFTLLQNEEARAQLRVLLISTYLNDIHLQKSEASQLILSIGTLLLLVA